MSDADERIVMYSDYVCPFCYLGSQSLAEYRAERTTELGVDWHPFDLRGQKRGPAGEIDHSIDDGKDDEYFERVRENVDRLKERYGADEMLDLDDLPEVDSLDAQIASLYVKREHPGKWDAFDEALFSALWIEGLDIGEPEILANIADGVGIPPSEIDDALEDETLRAEIFEQFDDAHRAGVTGVPTFAYDGYVARGAVPPERLRRLVEGNRRVTTGPPRRGSAGVTEKVIDDPAMYCPPRVLPTPIGG